jgi:Cellulase (glycosyl hydrolase family 5)
MSHLRAWSLVALTINTIVLFSACQLAPSKVAPAVTTPPEAPTKSVTPSPVQSDVVSPVRLRVSGDKILTPEGNPIELRGVNWGWWGTAQSQDAREAAVLGVNVVRIPFRWYFEGEKSDIRDSNAPGNISPEGLRLLDQYINWCIEQKIWVVLFGGSDRGAGNSQDNYWTNPELRQEFFETWEFLVQRYRGLPYIAAYEILSEPHPKKPATSKDLLKFYQEAIEVIRRNDPQTPIIIGPNDHYDINQLEDVYTNQDNKLIYTFNFYLPTEYVKTQKRAERGLPLISYPGTYEDRDGQTITLNKEYLATLLAPAIDFRSKYNVPVFVNQVGVRSEAPGSLQYMADVLDLFYQNNIAFTYWTYRTRHNNSQHGLYWMDENGTYHPKRDQIEVLRRALNRR